MVDRGAEVVRIRIPVVDGLANCNRSAHAGSDPDPVELRALAFEWINPKSWIVARARPARSQPAVARAPASVR